MALDGPCCRMYLDLLAIDHASFLQLRLQQGSLEISASPIAGAGVQSFVHGIDRFSPAGEVQTYCRALLGTEPELKIDIVQIDPATATVCHTTIFFQKNLFAEYLPLATS